MTRVFCCVEQRRHPVAQDVLDALEAARWTGERRTRHWRTVLGHLIHNIPYADLLNVQRWRGERISPDGDVRG